MGTREAVSEAVTADDPAAGQTYYAKWTDSVDKIPGKDEGKQMDVDLGSAVYGDTPSATVLFDGADGLKEVKLDYGYFDAAINGMRVTITPKAGLQPGTDAKHFSPDAACTRGQIVTFLYRAAGSPAGYANSGCTDVPETSYCAAPVAWAVALRITSGTGTLTFSPDDLCTRAQIVTFLYRANA